MALMPTFTFSGTALRVVVTTICDIVTLMYSSGGLPPFFRLNVNFDPRDATPRARSDRPPHQFDAVWHRPVVRLHTSVVHTLPSLQRTVLVVWHCPVSVLQASVVHALVSLQVTVLEVWHCPLVLLQNSVVHA